MDTNLGAPAASSTGASSSEGSYVESLSGAADPGTVGDVLSSDSSSLEQGGQIADGQQDDTGVDTGTEATGADAQFEQMAKEAGFEDLKNLNPAQRQALKALIARMQPGQDGKAAAGTPATDSPEELTDLEKELAATTAATAAAASQPAKDAPQTAAEAEPQQPARHQYGDVGDKWTAPKDAYAELSEAYQAGDLDKVHQIDGAMFARRFDAIARPFLAQQVEAGVQEALKKMGLNNVLPQVEKDLQERRTSTNIEVAKKNVGKLPGNEGFAKMFEPVEAGKTVTFRGQEYPDTPYNRIMMANPELMSIRVNHADPDGAEQLTYIAIYRAAMRLHRQSEQQQKSIQPEQAKQLVQAGAKILNKTETDRTRQTMNAGVGATGAGSQLGKKGANGSYIAEINKPAGELSVSDLFS